MVENVPWQPKINPPQRQFDNPRQKDIRGALLDKPQLGGKVTICVLCHGDYFTMQHQCLESIVRTVPEDRMDLRVIANAAGQKTIDYLAKLPVRKIYLHDKNKFKYPAMREVFKDEKDPIETNYVIWFDDCARVSHGNWLNLLAEDISKQPDYVGMYGAKMTYVFKTHRPKDPREWFKRQSWHHGKPFRTRKGNPAPNGDSIHFCAGWFWAIRTDVLREHDIPCEAAIQQGGDILIGEQLYQAGYKIKSFNAGKALVYKPMKEQLPRPSSKGRYPWQ